MDHHKPSFEPGHFYHVYNRAVGSEKLFREDKNYTFFLERWEKYIIPYANIWAYCLMTNHFHSLIKIKNEEGISQDLKGFENLSGLLSKKFSDFINSYAKSYNKIYHRHGSLFQKPFKRIQVDTENYLLMLIHYIHHNPIHHGIAEDYSSGEFSSYRAMLSSGPTKIERAEVLSFFGGREKFLEYHAEMKNYNKIHHLIIE